jgi:hypothetical protein
MKAPAVYRRKRRLDATPLPRRFAFLQHGKGTGPFLTERVELETRDGILRAWWHETLRPVHCERYDVAKGMVRPYIIGHDGERIALVFEGA